MVDDMDRVDLVDGVKGVGVWWGKAACQPIEMSSVFWKSMKSCVLGLVLFIFAGVLCRAASNLDPVVELLGQIDDPAFHADLLKGMREGLAGQKNVATPKGWAEVAAKLAKSPNEQVREDVRALSLIFGDAGALDSLKATLVDKKSPVEKRRDALKLLVEKKAPGLAPVLQSLILEKGLQGDVLRGLAAYDSKETPKVILKNYPVFSTENKVIAVGTLGSREGFAKELLAALANGKIPRKDISVPIARQIQSLGNKELSELLKKHWGEIRQVKEDKAELMEKYKKMLPAKYLAKADLSNGRALYNRTCAACHVLYGEGGKIGPDITGSDRRNLDYVLDNVLDPNGAIGKDYQFTTIHLKDGRVVGGMVAAENNSSLTVQTVTERIILSKEEVVARNVLPISMMPEGLFNNLKKDELRDLVAYLATEQQVPLKKL